MQRITTLILVAMMSLPSFAQELKYRIFGIVKDEFNEGALGASVRLTKEDGTYVAATTVEDDGSFNLTEIAVGKFKITFSQIGSQEIVKDIDVNNKDINLGIIRFVSQSTTLKSVEVSGTRIAAKQSGDTVDYSADAFKVNPDATAEDLVRKMPGIDLSGGTVKAQGENVGKVLVDGKPFFGDDAANTLKNLPAEVISKIQVYDEKSEQSRLTGVDDGETIKAINIVTKAEKREGVFGKVYAGGGVDAQTLFNNNGAADFLYSLGGNINSFKGNRRISLVAQSNNINNQNFSSQDLLGVASSGGGRGGRGGMRGPGGGGPGGNASSNFMVGTKNGVATTNAVGINYSDKLGAKVDITASYFFNKSNTYTNQITNREYVTNENLGQKYDESSVANATNFNHRINARLTYNIDSQNTLIWVPSVSLQANNSNSNLTGVTTLPGTTLNSTNNIFNSELSGYNFNNMLIYFHRFKKQGRSFNIHSGITGNQNKGVSDFFANNLYYTNANLNDTINQESDIDRTGLTFRTSAQYSEPLSKKSNIQISYTNTYQKTNSEKLTYNYDELTDAYAFQDSLLSNKFMSLYQTNAVGLNYGYNDQKIRANFGANAQIATLTGERVLPYGSDINRSFKNILPRVMVQYNFSKSKNLGLFYRTSTNAPSVNELQDVIDNSNPLQLSSGNPNLKQSYTHNLFSRYTATNTNNNSTFFLMLRGTTTKDYVGKNTIIAADETEIRPGVILGKGGQYTTQTNLDGYYNLNAFTTYGTPVTALRSNINVNLNAGLTRIPGLINGAKNFSNNRNVGLGLVFSSNISERIDFTLSSNANMNFVKNTLNSNADNNYLNQSTRFTANYMFWKGMVLNTELNHQFFSGLINNSNQNYLLWNAGIAKKIFKKQQGEIKLSVFDILGQNASFAQTYTEAYNETLRSNVLQRYFMLTFTYNIRAFKSGSSEKDMEQGQNFGRPAGAPAGMPPGHPGM
jgi:hypothetical protein